MIETLKANAPIIFELVVIAGGTLVFCFYQIRKMDKLKAEREAKQAEEAGAKSDEFQS